MDLNANEQKEPVGGWQRSELPHQRKSGEKSVTTRSHAELGHRTPSSQDTRTVGTHAHSGATLGKGLKEAGPGPLRHLPKASHKWILQLPLRTLLTVSSPQ